ncbi:hypothetical protein JL720_2598 [Aureococcus anophagefferens]|nr:hypothetical protein JL720_2598 [Aureococcus anophagefferens]
MAADDAWCPRGAEDLGVASSVGGLWARNAASRPSSRCVAEYSSAAGAEAGRLSWGEFDAAAWGCGLALAALAPERVALLAHPTAAQYCCAAGAARAGLSACLLNWRQPAAALSHAVAVAAPEALVASRPFAALAAEASAGNVPVARLGAVALAQCRNAARASAAVGAGAFAGPDPPPTLAFLPNFHVIGFVLNFVLPAFLGAPCATHAECESSPLSLALLLGAAAALGPATVDTVPALLEDLARRPDLAAAARPFVGPAVAYGGAPLAPWAAAKLRAAGVRAFSQYGATEHGGPLLVGAAGDALGAMRGTGGCDLVLDADGYRSPDVLEGELQGSKRLVVLGCGYVTPGYLGAPAPSPPFEAERRTGDVFRRVESAGGAAFAYVCRRDDLLVLSSGELANPLPLEARLAAELPPDVRACVIGQGRTSPVVVVSKRVPRAALARACAAANRAAESYARVAPDRAVFLDDGEPWPTNAKGVVVRGALEAAARDRADALDEVHVVGDGDDDDASSDDAAPGPDLRGAILDEVEALTGHRLGADAPLLGARGLSSSGVFALSRALGERLGRTVAPARVFDFPSAAALAGALAGRGAPRAAAAVERARSAAAAVAAAALSFGGGAGDARAAAAAGAAAPRAPCLARWAAPPPDARRLRAAAYGTFFADASTLFAFDGGAGLGLGPAEARVADPQTFLVLEAGGQVLEASGALAGGEKRVGVFTAFMGGDAASLRGPVAVPVGAVNSPYELSGCGASTVGARLSYAFALTGPAAAVDTACSSSLAAARMALQEIRDGACAFAALVAPNLMLDGRYPHAGLAIIGMLSARGRCHALDDRADGFLRCEGSAAFALVPDGDASSTAPPAVLGLGLGHNGHAASFLAPNGAAQRRCVDAARRDAGPGGAYASLELHGTGTALGDPVEIGGLAAAGESGALALSGVKATLGHAESCAGCAGLGDALLAAARAAEPPPPRLNPQLAPPPPGLNWHVDAAGATDRNARGGVSSFGWSGVLAHAALRPGPVPAPRAAGAAERLRAAVPCRDWCAQKRRWVAAQGARGAAPAAPAAPAAAAAPARRTAASSPRSSRWFPEALDAPDAGLMELGASSLDLQSIADDLGQRASADPVRAAAVFAPGARAPPPFFALTDGAASVASGRVSFALGLRGACLTLDTACSASLVGLHVGAFEASSGSADSALCGGVNAADHGASRQCAAAGMISPNGRCHTFDARADGYARGDGALEALLRAVAAVVRAVAAGESKLVLEAHGTGTALGDPIEVGAARRARAETGEVRAQSCKCLFGHGEPAAGLAGAAALLAGGAAVAPSAALRSANAHVALAFAFALGAAPAADAAPAAGSGGRVSSFGFSGTIAHAAFAVLGPGPCARRRRVGAPARRSGAARPGRSRPRPPGLLRATIRDEAAADVPEEEAADGGDLLDAMVAARDHLGVATIDADEPLLAAEGADSLALTSLHAAMQDLASLELPATARRPRRPRATARAAPVVVLGAVAALPGAVGSLPGLLALAARGGDAATAAPTARMCYDGALAEARGPTAPGTYGGFLIEAEVFGDLPASLGLGAREAAEVDAKQVDVLRAAARLETGKTADVAVFVGLVGLLSEEVYRPPCCAFGARTTGAYVAVGAALSVGAGRVSYGLGLTGPAVALDTACSAGLVAAHLAGRALGNGDAAAALVVACSRLSRAGNDILAAGGMLSAGGRCHTLDGRGDGYLRAEGTVGAALAPEENPAAELAASGAKAEGRSASLTAPNGSVQAQLLAETWDRLERDAPGFGYELHGTGTALGDPVEVGGGARSTAATTNESPRPRSLKSNVGHLEAAAGLAGFAACLRAAAADAAGPAAQLRRVNGHLGALLDGETIVAPATRRRGAPPLRRRGRRRGTRPRSARPATLSAAVGPSGAVAGVRRRAAGADGALMEAGLDSLGLCDLGEGLQAALSTLLPALFFDRPTVDAVEAFLHEGDDDGDVAAAAPPAAAADGADDAVAAPSLSFLIPFAVRSFAALRNLSLGARVASQTIPASRWERMPGAAQYGALVGDDVALHAADFGISPLAAARDDPQQVHILQCCYGALAACAQSRAALAGTAVGVFAGAAAASWRDDDPTWSPVTYAPDPLGVVLCVAAGRASFLLGLHGPCVALDTACASSLVCGHLAAGSVAARESEGLAVAAGALVHREYVLNLVSAAGMVSRLGRCHTWDARADGYARAEGCVALSVSEAAPASRPWRAALAAGPPAWASSGVRCDGASASLTAPNGTAQRALLRVVTSSLPAALRADVQCESHGTGTALGDPMELGAVAAALRDADSVMVASLKAHVGHLEAAAGGGGVAHALACSVARANPQLRRVNAHLGPVVSGAGARAPAGLTPMPGAPFPRRVSSFGFGGTIARAVVGGASPGAASASALRAGTAAFAPLRKTHWRAAQGVFRAGGAARDALAAAMAAKPPAGPASATTATFASPRAAVAGALEALGLPRDAAMADVDSLGVTALASAVNDACGVSIGVGDFIALESSAEVIAMVAAAVEDRGDVVEALGDAAAPGGLWRPEGYDLVVRGRPARARDGGRRERWSSSTTSAGNQRRRRGRGARGAYAAAAGRRSAGGRPPSSSAAAPARGSRRASPRRSTRSRSCSSTRRGGAGTDPGRSDAVDRGRLVGRGSAGEFAAAFYGGYAAAKFGAGALDDAAAPGATVADARRRLRRRRAREDLDALREFAFHYAPEPWGDGPARGVEVRTPAVARSLGRALRSGRGRARRFARSAAPRAAGGRRYPFEMILVEPVPPYQRTRAPDETLLEHAARFGDKCLCAEMFPALFGTGDVTLDLGGRVARRELRTQDALWAFLCGAVGLDGRFAGDFEKMTEFIFNLRLEPPRAALDRDVHYFLIEPDGWKHYDFFYWGYKGDLVEPWKDFVAPGREFTVHRGVEGNHFQAFDTDANMDVIKAVVQPLLDGLDRRPAADAAVENE